MYKSQVKHFAILNNKTTCVLEPHNQNIQVKKTHAFQGGKIIRYYTIAH